MLERIVKPEILDNLDTADPAAVRSRKDLRLINWFMRNERWILKQLEQLQQAKPITKIIEMGAGDGILIQKIKAQFPDAEVIACDLINKPNHIDDTILWQSGNIMDYDGFDDQSVLITNLFIHHLDDEQLWELSEKISSCRALVIAEPHRYWFSKLLGYLTCPLVNYVTRHDMIVSIDAGFRFGELAGLLHLDWHWDERLTAGGIHAITQKKQ